MPETHLGGQPPREWGHRWRGRGSRWECGCSEEALAMQRKKLTLVYLWFPS